MVPKAGFARFPDVRSHVRCVLAESRSYPVASPASENQIAAMFDRVAMRYDFLNSLLSARQDQRWRRHLARMVPYRPKGYLLDVATGTGDVLFACARQHPEYASFAGVDISGEMLTLAQRKSLTEFQGAADSSNDNLGKVTWRQMSATSLEFKDESTDCLTISFGLRNVVDKETALSEFYRVLKPGGVLIIMEFFEPQSHVFSRMFQFYFRHVLPMIGGLFSDRSAYHYLPRSVGSFYSPLALRDALKQAQFILAEEVNFLFGSCRIVKARKR